VDHQRNIFGIYFEFGVMAVMRFVAGVENGSMQVLLSVLVIGDAVAMLV
jgi:hypothetical protein